MKRDGLTVTDMFSVPLLNDHRWSKSLSVGGVSALLKQRQQQNTISTKHLQPRFAFRIIM